MRDVLEGQQRTAVHGAQAQPVGAERVWFAVPRRLVTGAVAQPERLPVELRERPRVRAVQDHLPQ